MKWLNVLMALMAIILAPAVIAGVDEKAPNKQGVEGSWEGQLRVTPQIALRITLDVAKGNDGSLSGKWGSPDEGLKHLPLESIALQDGVLTFFAKTAGATYKGKLNESETEVVGDMDPGRQERSC